MLLADASRHRFTWWPVMFPVLALGLGLVTVAAASTASVGGALLPGALTLGVLGWSALRWLRVHREGHEIVVRSVLHVRRVPARGASMALVQGGGRRAPHLDVLLQVAGEEPLCLARLEVFGVMRAPSMARRIAEGLDVPVDEASLGPFEAQFAEARRQRRVALRWMAAVFAVAMVWSVVMHFVTASTMAMVVIRCSGGQTRLGSATILGDMEMTLDPGVHRFELHPPGAPAWSQQVELVASETTMLDCHARPTEPAPKR